MASTSAVHAPAIRPVRGTRNTTAVRPRLTVVATPKAAGSSMPFTLLGQAQRLTEEGQALAETNERLGTPQELERQAREIGMVPVSDPAYIDLDTGEIIGETSPAEQTGTNPELAEVPADVAVPPAQIYDESTAYHGMGNEGA